VATRFHLRQHARRLDGNHELHRLSFRAIETDYLKIIQELLG